MFSRFFIERPVLSNVLALVMILIGAVALLRLPVAQYPNVTPPTVSVTTRYPGASAKTVMDTIALPIEQQVNGVQGMLYMQSTSASDGSYSLIVTFAIGTDPNMAQVLVQNRVSARARAIAAVGAGAGDHRPEEVDRGPDVRHADVAGQPLRQPVPRELRRHQSAERARAPAGRGQRQRLSAPASMPCASGWTRTSCRHAASRRVTSINAIQQQSQEVTAGSIGMPPAPEGQNFQYTVNVTGRFNDARDFESIVVKVDNQAGGRITRVRDIGRVELGAQTYSQNFMFNGAPAAGIGIFQLPDANALTVATGVRAKMDQLAKVFPAGARL